MQEPASSKTVTILVIDNDKQVRVLCRQCLIRAGFTVLESDNGFQALLIAANYDGFIDLLITDVEMPHIRGPELVHGFKALWPRTRALFISGFYNESIQAELGADAAFLLKPFTPEKLVETVASVLAARQTPTHTRNHKRQASSSKRAACRECERLGREYGELMLSHVTLEEKFMAAKLRHDHELAKAVVQQMHHLSSEMALMRQAMRDHRNHAHPD